MRGYSPPKYLVLYAKVFLVISTIYSMAFLIQVSFLKNWDKTWNLVLSPKSLYFTPPPKPKNPSENVCTLPTNH